LSCFPFFLDHFVVLVEDRRDDRGVLVVLVEDRRDGHGVLVDLVEGVLRVLEVLGDVLDLDGFHFDSGGFGLVDRY